MRALLALIGCCLALIVTPARAQSPFNPEPAQIAALRKELQRQRKTQDTLKKDLKAARSTVDDLNRKTADQDAALDAMNLELARIWASGAVGMAVLLFVLLIIAFRRPRASTPPDELQQRLAALDRKLRDLNP